MKKLTVVLTLASSFSAFSGDLVLGDLNFFQKKNAALLSTSLNYSYSTFEEVSATFGSNDFEASSIHFTNSLTYGLSDKTNVGLGVNYALRNRTYFENPPSGINELRTQEEGLSDFTILGNHRIWDENFFLDVIGGLTLGFGNKEVAFGTQNGVTEGNNYQGNHSLNLALATGQKREDNWEWRSFAGFDFHFAGKGDLIDDDISSTEYDSDRSLNWKLGGTVQYRTNYNWALAASLDYTIVDRLKLDTGFANSDLELESDNYFKLGFIGKYNVSEFILINLGYDFVPRYDVSVTRGTDERERENGAGHKLSAGAQILF